MAAIDEVTRRGGGKVFRARVRVKGRPPETKTFTTKTAAKRWAQEKEVQLRRERDFGSVGATKKTVAELIDRYCEFELPKKRNNQDTLKTSLNWWKAEIGKRKLADLSPAILAECRDRLLLSSHEHHRFTGSNPKKKSAGTVIRYMAALSHALTIAVNEWEWLDSNPILKVRKPEQPQSRVRFLDEDERKSLLEACQASSCSYLYPIVVIALSTGARYGEIMNLRWQDVDLERGVARLEKTKNKERRALPLTHLSLSLIKELRRKKKPAKTDFLFPRADGLKPLDIRSHWRKALKNSEIEDFRFHDLRHTAASYLAMNGATLAEIAEVLGHKTLQMVKRYAHLSDQHTAGVVERMNRKIFSDDIEGED